MSYIEMSRDENHGGGTWAYGNCVWAPTRKKSGARWPYWSKVSNIREGDLVIHLRGKQPNAVFDGYSIASGNGFETKSRPPDPGEWDFATSFYRADLAGFVQFHVPIALTSLFDSRRAEMEDYFDRNQGRKKGRHHLFYDKKIRGLECHQGAYLTDVDEELFSIMFPNEGTVSGSNNVPPYLTIETSTQIRLVRTRLGQERFSREIKRLYGHSCCFPGCNVSDERLLVGAHIARWSDNETLRGDMGNGLCFCLLHDKAFELGMFTLDQEFRVFVNPREMHAPSWVSEELKSKHGEAIRLAALMPRGDALLEHWIRVDIDPQSIHMIAVPNP